MNIKKGDKVEVLTGRDGGKTGRVLSVDPRNERVIVEKLNFVKRHRRPRKEGEKGEIVNANYLTGSLTTYGGRNPGFRIYDIDAETMKVVNFVQYRLNLTKANEKEGKF